MRLQIFFCAVALSLAGLMNCRPAMTEAGDPGVGGNMSGASSISIALPAKDALKPELRDKLSGFRLTVDRLEGTCQAPAQLIKAGPYANATLTESLSQGCDYSIGLEVGALESSGASLLKTYFSNFTAPRQGRIIRRAEIQGRRDLSIDIPLKITQQGIADGFSSVPGPQGGGTPGGSSVDINIVIPTPTPGGSVQPTPSPTGVAPVTWQSVASDAARLCARCHVEAKEEAWWKPRKSEIQDRLTTSDAGRKMPQNNSPEATQATADVRKKLTDFIRTLP